MFPLPRLPHPLRNLVIIHILLGLTWPVIVRVRMGVTIPTHTYCRATFGTCDGMLLPLHLLRAGLSTLRASRGAVEGSIKFLWVRIIVQAGIGVRHRLVRLTF